MYTIETARPAALLGACAPCSFSKPPVADCTRLSLLCLAFLLLPASTYCFDLHGLLAPQSCNYAHSGELERERQDTMRACRQQMCAHLKEEAAQAPIVTLTHRLPLPAACGSRLPSCPCCTPPPPQLLCVCRPWAVLPPCAPHAVGRPWRRPLPLLPPPLLGRVPPGSWAAQMGHTILFNF